MLPLFQAKAYDACVNKRPLVCRYCSKNCGNKIDDFKSHVRMHHPKEYEEEL